MRTNHALTLAIATALLAFGAQAQGAAVEIETIAQKEIEFTGPDGQVELKLVPAEKVLPGEEVVYTIHARNRGGENATSVVITDPIPDHMVYRNGSAAGDGTEITFSVDGGKTYAAASKLVVREDDGTVRPATASDYSHIRWKFNDAIEPGVDRSVRFRARLQ